MFKVDANDDVLVSLLLTLNMFCSSVSIINFEQVKTSWKSLILDVYQGPI